MTPSPQIAAAAEPAFGDAGSLKQEADAITAALLHEGWQRREYLPGRAPPLTWRALWRWLLAQPTAPAIARDMDHALREAWRRLILLEPIAEQPRPSGDPSDGQPGGIPLESYVWLTAAQQAIPGDLMTRSSATPNRWPVDAHRIWQLGKEVRGAGPCLHPLAPLISAWLDANPPIVRPDRWPQGTMPRLVTRERRGEPPQIRGVTSSPSMIAQQRLPGLGRFDGSVCPHIAYLPGFEPADTPSRIIPASWLALITAFAELSKDPRQWQLPLRLLIEITSTPDPRERRTVVRVDFPVTGRDGLVRRLWPHDRHVARHYPDLRRAIGLVVTAALPAGEGHAYLPVELLQQQTDDVVAFKVTYPTQGGNGAAFDRESLRCYGPLPRHLMTYLAARWALDAPSIQVGQGGKEGAEMPLDAFVALASHPTPLSTPRARENARHRTRRALKDLAGDGVIAFSEEGRRRRRLRLQDPDRHGHWPADDVA